MRPNFHYNWLMFKNPHQCRFHLPRERKWHVQGTCIFQVYEMQAEAVTSQSSLWQFAGNEQIPANSKREKPVAKAAINNEFWNRWEHRSYQQEAELKLLQRGGGIQKQVQWTIGSYQERSPIKQHVWSANCCKNLLNLCIDGPTQRSLDNSKSKCLCVFSKRKKNNIDHNSALSRKDVVGGKGSQGHGTNGN